jgi:hypothetical protein
MTKCSEAWRDKNELNYNYQMNFTNQQKDDKDNLLKTNVRLEYWERNIQPKWSDFVIG